MPEHLNQTREAEPAVADAPHPLGILNHPEANGIETTNLEDLEYYKDLSGNYITDRNGDPIPVSDTSTGSPLPRVQVDKAHYTRDPATGEYRLNPAIPPAVETARAPEEIRAEATSIAMGVVAFSLATDVTLEAGEIPYSELRSERIIGALAGRFTTATHTQEEAALLRATGAQDPAISNAAEEVIDSAIQPDVAPRYDALLAEITELERKASPTLGDKQRIGMLKREAGKLRRAHSADTPGHRIRGRLLRPAFPKSSDKKARKGDALLGRPIESTEALLDGEGRKLIGTLRRESREEDQIRNQVGKKGAILVRADGKKFVVKDVKSQPAQAFVVTGHKPDKSNPRLPGEPIFELDPLTGMPRLEEIYIQVEVPDPTSPTGKRKELKLVPRDDDYDTGEARHSIDGAYYYRNGTRIPRSAVGNDSFLPIDDIVELQRLFTAEEAFLRIMDGQGPHDEIEDWQIRMSDLERLVDDKDAEILKQKEAEEAKRDELVFETSVDRRFLRPPISVVNTPFRADTDPTELLTPYDASRVDEAGDPKLPGGHFRRFKYSDPETSRQKAQEEHLRAVGAARVDELKKKSREARGKKVRTI